MQHHTTLRPSSTFFLLALACLTTGCEKKKPATDAASPASAVSPAELAKMPEHQQLMNLLKHAQQQRLELSQAGSVLRRLESKYADDQKSANAELAALDAELTEMKGKYQAAQAKQTSNVAGAPPVTIEYGTIAYFLPNYLIIVAQKLDARKKLDARIARFNTSRGGFAEQLQQIGLKMNALATHEKEVRANISDVLLGHEARDLQQLTKKIGEIDVAAITKAVAEMQNKARDSLSEAAARAADAEKTKPSDTAAADAAAFLSGK